VPRIDASLFLQDPTSQQLIFCGTAVEQVTIQQVLWAAVTVGRANWQHVVKNGFYSYMEIISKISTVFASLDFTLQFHISSG
jgi:hypothetical protein